jgi:hypothetical protein
VSGAAAGLTIGGVLTGQPEVAGVGVAGETVGGVFTLVGNAAILWSDLISGQNGAAVQDVGKGAVDTLPSHPDFPNSGYLGY